MVTIRTDKVKVEVFVPLASCVCNYAPFMKKIGRITSKFKDLAEVQIKSTKSSEASKYGIEDMCVMVNGAVKLSAGFDERELENAILRKTE